MKASEIPHPTEEQKAEYDRFIKAKADQPHVYENSPFLAYHYTNADVLEPILAHGLLTRVQLEAAKGRKLDKLPIKHQQFDKVFFTTTEYFNIGHVPFWMWRSKLQKSAAGHVMEDYGRGCARIGVLQARPLVFNFDCETIMSAFFPEITGIWFTCDHAIPPDKFVLVEFYSPEQDKWLRISHKA